MQPESRPRPRLHRSSGPGPRVPQPASLHRAVLPPRPAAAPAPAAWTLPERLLAAAVLLLVAAAVLLPAWQPPAALLAPYADARTLAGLPHAMDVLTNLPFALAGLWGLWGLRRGPGGWGAAVPAALARLFFAGLVATAAGSGWYHLQPDADGLLWDRAGMALAFAGLLGLAAAHRVSARSGVALAALALPAGLLAAWLDAATGNVLPWALLQFGGLALVLGLALRPARAGLPALSLAAVIACYAVAKLLEMADHAVFEATGQWVSGHSLKHAVAALAAVPVRVAGVTRRHGAATVGVDNGAHRPARPWAEKRAPLRRTAPL